MDNIDSIFGYYDKLIGEFSPTIQIVTSLGLLFVLLLQIYHILRSGHWIFIVSLILLLPGTWPAAKKIANFVWLVIKFLITRIQLNI